MIGFTNALAFCYDPAMGRRLELATKALAIERVATGGLAAIMPGRAIGAIATAGSDAETARYLARLLGIRQVALGAMLWQSRDDRAWLRVAAPDGDAERPDGGARRRCHGRGRDAAARGSPQGGSRRRGARNVGRVPRPSRCGDLSSRPPRGATIQGSATSGSGLHLLE